MYIFKCYNNAVKQLISGRGNQSVGLLALGSMCVYVFACVTLFFLEEG